MRRAAKVDGNQTEIIEALRAAGASVEVIGRPVDLAVGFSGVTYLMEVKNLQTGYGKRGHNKNQRDFVATWNGGPTPCVASPEAALKAIGALA